MDCTDVKVLLSGLIDDEVDAEARHAAERHLVECAACRALLGEAEALTPLIAADVAPNGEGDGDDALPPELVGAVLARTVYAAPPASGGVSWTNWLGWLAAAAALALAISLWMMDLGPRSTVVVDRGPDPLVDPDRPGVVTTQLLASTVYEGDLDARAVEIELAQGPTLTLADVRALESAAWLLDMLLAPADVGAADVELIRSMTIYDEVLASLTTLRTRLDVDERAVVFAAENVLREIALGTASVDDVARLRAGAADAELPTRLTSLASRGATSAL
jgi:hypothetical protein